MSKKKQLLAFFIRDDAGFFFLNRVKDETSNVKIMEQRLSKGKKK